MDNSIKEIAADILKINIEDLDKSYKYVEKYDLHFFWQPKIGGLQMIISNSKEKLVVSSSISFNTLLAEFVAGKRN